MRLDELSGKFQSCFAQAINEGVTGTMPATTERNAARVDAAGLPQLRIYFNPPLPGDRHSSDPTRIELWAFDDYRLILAPDAAALRRAAIAALEGQHTKTATAQLHRLAQPEDTEADQGLLRRIEMRACHLFYADPMVVEIANLDKIEARVVQEVGSGKRPVSELADWLRGYQDVIWPAGAAAKAVRLAANIRPDDVEFVQRDKLRRLSELTEMSVGSGKPPFKATHWWLVGIRSQLNRLTTEAYREIPPAGPVPHFGAAEAAEIVNLAVDIGSSSAIVMSEAGDAFEARLSQTLPRECPHWRELRALGVEVLATVDDLSVRVKLPEGWEIRPGSHVLYRYMHDERGTEVTTIFERFAIHDRKAWMSLTLPVRVRFRLLPDLPGWYYRSAGYKVRDGKKVVYRTEQIERPEQYAPEPEWAPFYERMTRLRQEAQEWLEANHPGWRNMLLPAPQSEPEE